MYPTYVMINGERYDINTDFRVAIECNSIAQDESIGDMERTLAIIYKLFGEKGLKSDKILELSDKCLKYLSCGQEIEPNNEEPDMDYEEDMDYIEASFMSDYGIDLENTKMHWWKFNKYMNGLSNSEMGNCCILNRVRNIRNYDLKDIKDSKERAKMQKAKEMVALHKKPKTKTEDQKKSSEDFYKDFIL